MDDEDVLELLLTFDQWVTYIPENDPDASEFDRMRRRSRAIRTKTRNYLFDKGIDATPEFLKEMQREAEEEED